MMWGRFSQPAEHPSGDFRGRAAENEMLCKERDYKKIPLYRANSNKQGSQHPAPVPLSQEGPERFDDIQVGEKLPYVPGHL